MTWMMLLLGLCVLFLIAAVVLGLLIGGGSSRCRKQAMNQDAEDAMATLDKGLKRMQERIGNLETIMFDKKD